MPETLTHSFAGPEALLALKSRHVMPCVHHFYQDPPQIVAGEGVYLFDHLGRRYLDCCAGVAVMNAGHCNPAIIEPAIEQIRTLGHTTSIYLTEPALRLAQQLARLTPGDLMRSFFCASGSEAVEGALLLATLHTGRAEFIAMRHALHGRTRGAMNVTGLEMWRTDPFPPGGVHHVPFNDVDAVALVLKERGHHIAAVLGEPVLGNGGIQPPLPDFWPRVRRLCDRHGVLLILDEIQTGFGRTGTRFACDHWNVTPDIMALSKALGNGFPIAAFITTDRIAASYTRPGASTYGGNPVCAAAALATLAFHESQDLAGNARRMGELLRGALGQVARRHACLTPPRGMGLMLGMEVIDNVGNPDPAALDQILENLKDHGVLATRTGPQRNVLTFLPPLTVTTDHIGELIDALERALDQ